MGQQDSLVRLILVETHRIWRAEWARYDLCAELVKTMPDEELRPFVRSELGLSHRTVYRWAENARLVPPDKREDMYSPQTQIRLAKKYGA